MTGDARDPHTMAFDDRGYLWFTSQGSNRIGRLTVATREVEIVPAADSPSNPYGLIIDHEGNPWVSLLRTNAVVRVDPSSMELTRFTEKDEASRSRRIERTADGMVWYGDEARGYIGRINPDTGEVTEWQAPGGADSRPYALTKDGADRLWLSETGSNKQLVGFDPLTEEFFAVIPVSGNIRNMDYDPRTDTMWFGTDANKIGRIVTGSDVN
jgi:virginiamycin B lyase